MSRQQLIVLVVAIAAVLLLFSLPKVLLNKEEKELENSTELEKMEQPITEHAESGHAKLEAKDQATAQKIKSQLAVATKPSDKIQLLDSLSNIYNAVSLYDSSAILHEKFLKDEVGTESLIALGDACYKAYYFAADDAQAAGWGKKTQQYYQKALDQHPELLDVKARLAMTYTRGTNPMQAIATLREVLDKDPENEQALLNIGLLSIQSGQYGKAVERFTKLIAVNPQNWLGFFYLGIAYAESGKKADAKVCFEKVKKNEKQPQLVQAAEEYLKQLSTN